ncbi:hypothetical protein FHR23_003346 [Stakelama sediminis]|uniref:Uncharacterized protein n=1 Tax=Stakelama sediminis TaxID=463200 RepID=A0A840Z3J5_9SPHN|nr:hypothetical protein [Stakelama sediminis]MBB5720379.1 hypothetical protein [Stakelama sediminis]
MAGLLLAENNPAAALPYAIRDVRTNPIDPSATATLGTVLLNLEKPQAALAAFTVSGSLGWRNIPTQLYWLAESQLTDNVEGAAQRIDALLRIGSDNEAVENALQGLSETALGQKALIALLRETPPWEERFILGARQLSGAILDSRLSIIERAVALGAPVDCEAVAQVVNWMVRQDSIYDAEQFWRNSCDNGNHALLSDGSFESGHSSTTANPFAWHLNSRGGMDATVEDAPNPLKGKALHINSSMSVRTAAANQVVTLKPGNYTISWRTAQDDGSPDVSVTIRLQCLDDKSWITSFTPSQRSDKNSFEANFSIPQNGCQIQNLVIQKEAISLLNPHSSWISDIVLKAN